MGTNFYLKRIPKASEYEAMQEALTNKELHKLQDQVQHALQKYHIGKRSKGWAFLFQAKTPPHEYDKEGMSKVPWEMNLESLKTFVNDSENYEILDEYGHTFTPQEFWDNEVSETLLINENHIDIRTWNKLHPGPDEIEDIHDEFVINDTRWSNSYFS